MASSSRPEPNGGVSLPLTDQQKSTHFDNAIWYTLALWPALTVAVQNSFGGPDSNEKRDWIAGAISDLFVSHPQTDHDDLVIFLLQIMTDEFDVQVEDDSEEIVAGEIMKLRQTVVGEGRVEGVRAVERRWRERGQVKLELRVQEVDQEGEWSEVEDEDGDVEMRGVEEGVDIAPQLVSAKLKEKVQPEIDEDGFEKVVGKKKR